MKTITKYLASIILIVSIAMANAQETTSTNNNSEKIEILKALKEKIRTEEREFLKEEVEAINTRFETNEIKEAEANRLKKEVAKNRALNIENRLAIVDNKIALLERNSDVSMVSNDEDDVFTFRIGRRENDGDGFIYFGAKRYDKPRKYDRRTTSDMVLAFGLNNAIVEGESFDESPYKIGGSRFFEIGWAWKTRVFENSNFLRLKYGYSFQINGLKPKDNMYFVQDGNETMLEEFPSELKKAKLSISNLVFPVHFEFGPSKRIDRDTYFRYSTSNQFKIGIGGYTGFNIGTRQKLKYSMDGEKVKDKIKRSFNATGLVYGLSGYIAFDDTALYVKYDLSAIFEDQAIKQNNISVGVRFDMD
mgnify:CR=1 FL=1|jgi:hypothetical protein